MSAIKSTTPTMHHHRTIQGHSRHPSSRPKLPPSAPLPSSIITVITVSSLLLLAAIASVEMAAGIHRTIPAVTAGSVAAPAVAHPPPLRVLGKAPPSLRSASSPRHHISAPFIGSVFPSVVFAAAATPPPALPRERRHCGDWTVYTGNGSVYTEATPFLFHGERVPLYRPSTVVRIRIAVAAADPESPGDVRFYPGTQATSFPAKLPGEPEDLVLRSVATGIPVAGRQAFVADHTLAPLEWAGLLFGSDTLHFLEYGVDNTVKCTRKVTYPMRNLRNGALKADHPRWDPAITPRHFLENAASKTLKIQRNAATGFQEILDAGYTMNVALSNRARCNALTVELNVTYETGGRDAEMEVPAGLPLGVYSVCIKMMHGSTSITEWTSLADIVGDSRENLIIGTEYAPRLYSYAIPMFYLPNGNGGGGWGVFPGPLYDHPVGNLKVRVVVDKLLNLPNIPWTHFGLDLSSGYCTSLTQYSFHRSALQTFNGTHDMAEVNVPTDDNGPATTNGGRTSLCGAMSPEGPWVTLSLNSVVVTRCRPGMFFLPSLGCSTCGPSGNPCHGRGKCASEPWMHGVDYTPIVVCTCDDGYYGPECAQTVLDDIKLVGVDDGATVRHGSELSFVAGDLDDAIELTVVATGQVIMCPSYGSRGLHGPTKCTYTFHHRPSLFPRRNASSDDVVVKVGVRAVRTDVVTSPTPSYSNRTVTYTVYVTQATLTPTPPITTTPDVTETAAQTTTRGVTKSTELPITATTTIVTESKEVTNTPDPVATLTDSATEVPTKSTTATAAETVTLKHSESMTPSVGPALPDVSECFIAPIEIHTQLFWEEDGEAVAPVYTMPYWCGIPCLSATCQDGLSYSCETRLLTVNAVPTSLGRGGTPHCNLTFPLAAAPPDSGWHIRPMFFVFLFTPVQTKHLWLPPEVDTRSPFPVLIPSYSPFGIRYDRSLLCVEVRYCNAVELGQLVLKEDRARYRAAVKANRAMPYPYGLRRDRPHPNQTQFAPVVFRGIAEYPPPELVLFGECLQFRVSMPYLGYMYVETFSVRAPPQVGTVARAEEKGSLTGTPVPAAERVWRPTVAETRAAAKAPLPRTVPLKATDALSSVMRSHLVLPCLVSTCCTVAILLWFIGEHLFTRWEERRVRLMVEDVHRRAIAPLEVRRARFADSLEDHGEHGPSVGPSTHPSTRTSTRTSARTSAANTPSEGGMRARRSKK